MKKIRVLFVCMGNICRSPTAHGVFRSLVVREDLQSSIIVDSAGTHAYHVGEPPDRRAQQTAHQRGIDLADLRARRVTAEDIVGNDYVLAMDQENYQHLSTLCPPGLESKIALFLDFAPGSRGREVPDPYYGGPSGFERVFDMVEEAAEGLLADIKRQHLGL